MDKMSVNEAVRALGKSIQADPRYAAYYAAKEVCDKDEALQQLIGSFNMKRMSLQMAQEKLDKDEKRIAKLNADIQDLQETIVANESMQVYQKAEDAMNAMTQEVDQIITLCLHGEDPDTCHPQLHCDGNCGSCGEGSSCGGSCHQ